MRRLSILLVLSFLLLGACDDLNSDDKSGNDGEWALVPHDDDVFGDGNRGIRSIIEWNTGLVAVGWDYSGGHKDAAVWTSADGSNWTRVQDDEFGGLGDQEMWSVTEWNSGLVAVGYENLGGNEDAAVWTSTDGVTWIRVQDDDFGDSGPAGIGHQIMRSVISVETGVVTSGGPALVAVGKHSWESRDAAVWIFDGTDWTMVDNSQGAFQGVFGNDDNDEEMLSVVVGGPGLVAVGRDTSDPDGPAIDTDAAVWTFNSSANTWERVQDTDFGGSDHQRMWSVTEWNSVLVAVGNDELGGDWDAAVWTSTNGTDWARVSDAVFENSGNQYMRSVCAISSELVAVGYDSIQEAAAVWTSTDGVAWFRLPNVDFVFSGDRNHGNAEMLSVAVGGPGLVAAGSYRKEAAVWTLDSSTDNWERVTNLYWVFGGQFVQSINSVVDWNSTLIGVGRDGENAAVWTSTDGVTWLRVPHDDDIFGSPEYITMYSVVVGGPGLIAVGYEMIDPGAAPMNFDAVVWTFDSSTNTWARVQHDEENFGGRNSQLMNSVVYWDSSFIAVGRDGGDAGVWTSPDGSIWTRVQDEDFGGPDQQRMMSIVAGGPGLVAVGHDGSDAAVWTFDSSSGNWDREPHDESVFGGPSGRMMLSVTAWGPGLVAVGYDGGNAAVWLFDSSTSTWYRDDNYLPVDISPDRQRMTSVVAGGPGLVAVGYTHVDTKGEKAAVWTFDSSTNTWSEIPHDEEVFDGHNQYVWSVINGGPGLVAVGRYYTWGDDDAAVWYWTPDL